MAEISVNRRSVSQISVIEDPQLAYNRIFINTVGHDTTTLSPLWNKNFHMNGTTGSFEFTNSEHSTQGALFLSKGATNAYAASDSSPQSLTQYEYWHVSLDPINYPPKPAFATLGGQNLFNTAGNAQQASTNFTTTQYYYVYSRDIAESSALVGTTSTDRPTKYFYEDATNNNIYGIQDNSSGVTAIRRVNNYSVGGTSNQALSLTNNKIFFIGVDAFNFTYWIAVNDGTSNNYTVYKYHPTTFAQTTIFSNLNRGLAWNYLRGYPSNVYYTNNNTRRVFYSAHFDATYQLAPIRLIFDTSAGNVWANNCTVTYPGANNYNTYSSLYSTLSSGPTGVETGSNANPWFFKGHQFLASDGERYITFIMTDRNATTGSGPGRWNTVPKRTMLSYKILPGTGATLAAANDDVLQFHSSFAFSTLNDVPKTYLPISANGDFLCIPKTQGTDFLSFNPTSNVGWTRTSTYPVEMRSVGLDQTNRLWGIAYDKNFGSIHVLSPSVPINIVLTMAANTYSYNASNIYTSATLSAYNSLNARMAATVSLSIDGSSMVFQSSNTTSNTITTSASGDVTIPIVITGGGINNIIINSAI